MLTRKVELLDDFNPLYKASMSPMGYSPDQPMRFKVSYSDGSYIIASGRVLFLDTITYYPAKKLCGSWCGVPK